MAELTYDESAIIEVRRLTKSYGAVRAVGDVDLRIARREVFTADSTPSWDRPVQLLVGIVLGAAAVPRGRWLVIPSVVLAVRMLRGPGAYTHYIAGLVLATVAVARGWRQTRWPSTDAELGWLRAATPLAVLAVALGPDGRKDPYRVLFERLSVSRVQALVARLGLVRRPSAWTDISATGPPEAVGPDPQAPQLAIIACRPA